MFWNRNDVQHPVNKRHEQPWFSSLYRNIAVYSCISARINILLFLITWISHKARKKLYPVMFALNFSIQIGWKKDWQEAKGLHIYMYLFEKKNLLLKNFIIMSDNYLDLKVNVTCLWIIIICNIKFNLKLQVDHWFYIT